MPREHAERLYLERFAEYTEGWARVGRINASVVMLVVVLPAALAVSLLIGLGTSAALGRDLDMRLDLLGALRRLTAFLVAIPVLYYVLRLSRLGSLWGSYAKMLVFYLVLSTFAGLLIEFAEHREVHDDLWIAGIGDKYETRSPDPLTPAFLPVLLQAALMFLLATPLLRISSFASRGIVHSRLLSIIPNDVPALLVCLRQAVADVNRAIGSYHGAVLSPEDFKLLLLRDDGIAPSVAEVEGSWCLIIPRGILVLSRRDPDAVTSILAHELCHVIHGDVQLWYYDWIRIHIYRHRIVPVVVLGALNGILALASGSRLGLSSLAVGIAVPWLTRLSISKLRALREQSELLADLAAAISTSPETVSRTVLRFGGHTITGMTSQARAESVDRAFETSTSTSP